MKKTTKMKINKKAIILLSSGLDSFVSLHAAKKDADIILALTFDYGQRAYRDEVECAKKITESLNIEHKIIKLPFLRKVCDNPLCNKNKNLEFQNLGYDSANAVWVPNRNGLFLNIAAMYCDYLNAKYIIYGANKEEAQTFSDNSQEFNHAANSFFEFSTKSKPKILAPLANLQKYEIINLAIDMGLDLTLIKSCYDSTHKKHCGKCESCVRLKQAILKSKNKDLINLIF